MAQVASGEPGWEPISKVQVGPGSSQAKARQRGNTLQRSPALDQGTAMSDGTRNTPGRTLPAAPSLPCEPLSPEPPSASKKGCADPAGGSSEVAAHSQAAWGGAYTTVWVPVAVNCQATQLDDGIHQALRAPAGLKLAEGEVGLQKV